MRGKKREQEIGRVIAPESWIHGMIILVSNDQKSLFASTTAWSGTSSVCSMVRYGDAGNLPSPAGQATRFRVMETTTMPSAQVVLK